MKKTCSIFELLPILLEKCRKAGYMSVAINCRNKKVPRSMVWPESGVDGSVFVYPDVTEKRKGFEKIYCISDICEELGIHSGCSHGTQCQIKLLGEPQAWEYVGEKWLNISSEE